MPMEKQFRQTARCPQASAPCFEFMDIIFWIKYISLDVWSWIFSLGYTVVKVGIGKSYWYRTGSKIHSFLKTTSAPVNGLPGWSGSLCFFACCILHICFSLAFHRLFLSLSGNTVQIWHKSRYWIFTNFYKFYFIQF